MNRGAHSLHYRLFSWSLALLPASFRRRFGGAMEEAFLDGLADRAGLRRLAFTVVSVGNVIVTAAREGLRPTTANPAFHRGGPGRRAERGRVMGSIWQDIRFTLRALRRQPVFGTVIVLTLALGIGANTAIFSVINGVLLRPLPYVHPDELVVVHAHDVATPEQIGRMSRPDLEDIADLPGFRTLAGYSTSTMTLAAEGEPRVIATTHLTDGLLSTFSLSPSKGRDLTRADNVENGPRVVVVSHRFWQTELGGREEAVGGTITLSERTWQVVGVAPPGFTFPDETDIWLPHYTPEVGCGRGCHNFLTIGRLTPGTAVPTAQAQLTALSERFERDYPDSNFNVRFAARSLHTDIVGDVKAGLWVVLGAVGVVLLIACANVAILLLVRANAREGEMAIRTALGASRGRLLRQMLVESQLLAFLGGGLGILGAVGAVRLLRSYSADTIPRLEAVAIDGTVLTATLVITMVVALLFGFAPAVALARRGVAGGLSAAGRGSLSRPGDSHLRSVLMATEVALSLLLLTGSGLLLKTFAAMYRVDLGFETEEVTRFTLSVPSARYETLDQIAEFYRSLDERIATIPGVAAVGGVYGAPLGRGNITGDVLVAGRPEPAPGEATSGSIKTMTPGYLDVMGIPLLRGRPIEASDRDGGVPVALVNQQFVRENFPDEEPIGQRVRITATFGYTDPEWTIVGVVRDIRSRSLTRDPVAEIYVPHAQFGPGFLTVSVRGAPGAPPLLPGIRQAVRELDPLVPLRGVETVREAVTRQLAPTRFYLMLVGSFAALAVILSAVGLYGVVSYLVTRNTREIGIRLALGAGAREIVRLMATQGLRPAVIGIVAGLAASIAASRTLTSLLYDVTPTDPAVLVAVTGLVLVVSVGAAVFPARRAAGVDPVEVMRTE